MKHIVYFALFIIILSVAVASCNSNSYETSSYSTQPSSSEDPMTDAYRYVYEVGEQRYNAMVEASKN